MKHFNFFILVLIVSVVIAVGIAFAISEADIVPIGLTIAVLLSIFLTLFRILKKSNDPDNRLGNWKYFFALFFFVTGILVTVIVIFSDSANNILPVALIIGLLISSIISIVRSIKHWHHEKKAEKERKQQYQEQMQQQNKQYADELKKKDRIISELQSRNYELQNNQRTFNSSTSSSSTSRYQNQYYAEQIERQREQMRKQEEEDKKKERLEDWYRDYVTIQLRFDYHITPDGDSNFDYWDTRSEEIRVTRREAMALIQAGEKAIIGRAGYHNLGAIRNISYDVPYGLYNRPMNC